MYCLKKIALLSLTGLSKMALGRLTLAKDQPAIFKLHVLLINKGELTLPNLNLCQTLLFLHHLLLTALSRLSEALWLKDWVCCVVCAIGLMAWGILVSECIISFLFCFDIDIMFCLTLNM